MQDEHEESSLDTQPESPATDRLAHVMDWIGLSAAVGMIVAAIVIAA